MASIDIDKDLLAFLGLPDDYQLDKKEAFKIYMMFMGYIETKKKVTVWSLYYYADDHVDFYNNPKNKQDYIVKAIVDNMSKADQYEVLSYISLPLSE